MNKKLDSPSPGDLGVDGVGSGVDGVGSGVDGVGLGSNSST